MGAKDSVTDAVEAPSAEVSTPIEANLESSVVPLGDESTQFRGNESNVGEKTEEVGVVEAPPGEVAMDMEATPPTVQEVQEPETGIVHQEAETSPSAGYGTPEPSPVATPQTTVGFATFGSRAREFGARALLSRQVRKLKKFVTIMEKLHREGSISNSEVMRHVHVSHATATRYLGQLEKEGRIKKSTARGRATSYVKI